MRKTLRPSSVPSLFNWSKESTQRRQIIKTPLPQKRRKTDDDATDNDEELGSSNWLLHGALTFVSSLYTGCMSDVEITKLSGLLNLLDQGDSIMADKGFVLNKVLEGTGISINTPPFLMSQGQFTLQEVEETQAIAKLRIHIERHIRRVKEFHIFDGVIPLSMVGTINQIWTVANLLTLFRGPLVKEWA